MRKAIAVILVVSLLLPNILFAAPANEVQQTPLSESPQPPLLAKAGQDTSYSPTAKKIYLGTGIGTLAAGGVLVALGSELNGSDWTDKESSKVYTIGGILLAISTVLWALYFYERGKEPPASVGLELENKKGIIQAYFRF